MAESNMTIYTDIDETASVISSKIAPTLEEVLNKDVLEYYAQMTEE